VAHLIVADIAMRKNPLQAQQSYAEAMLRMNLAELTNRNEADEALAAQGVPDEGIRQFLLKSLTRNEQGSFAWRFNLKGLHAELEAIGEGIVQDALFLGPTLFVRGRQSNYVLPSDEGEILQHFPSAHIETINGAGHWLHADKPAEFLAMIKEELGV